MLLVLMGIVVCLAVLTWALYADERAINRERREAVRANRNLIAAGSRTRRPTSADAYRAHLDIRQDRGAA